MKLPFSFVAAILLVSMSIAAAQPAAVPAPVAGRAARPPAPTRDPLAPRFVKATELPDGQVPPMEADGNFIIYKFVFARGAGHTDRPTLSQLYPTALQWIWQGYPIGEN